MANLSAAAQAVLDAAINVAESPDAEAIVAAALGLLLIRWRPVMQWNHAIICLWRLSANASALNS